MFVCLFLPTFTGRNEAIIVELKEFPSLDFSQLRKMVPALSLNYIIVATNACRDKWNRHDGALFTHVQFLNFC